VHYLKHIVAVGLVARRNPNVPVAPVGVLFHGYHTSLGPIVREDSIKVHVWLASLKTPYVYSPFDSFSLLIPKVTLPLYSLFYRKLGKLSRENSHPAWGRNTKTYSG
jgi:hypothetical protein